MHAHETEIRVRYQETDAMGIVYYANYFVWLEVARSEYLRARGTTYRHLEAEGYYMMVVSASCRYKASARYDDIVRIESRVSEVKNTSFKFVYKIFRGQTLLAESESVHVLTNKEGKPARIPHEIKSLLLS